MFKPTYACNLKCKYCHVHEWRDAVPLSVSLDKVRLVFDWILNYCKEKNVDQVNILWHGGEPLLTGADKMQNIIEYYVNLFVNSGIDISSAIQTNLLLLNEEFLPIISRYFKNTVGFSFDYASSYRCYADGTDASKDIWAKVLWLKEKGIDLGCITQITDSNASKIDSVYEHFKSAGVNIKFSRIRATDTFSSNLSDEAYIKAVKRLFDLWVNDQPTSILISNFREYIKMLISGSGYSCVYQQECNLLSFTASGGIFYCDRAAFDSPVGNCLESSAADVDRNVLTRIKVPDRDVASCVNCRYYRVCHGGCLYNRMTGWNVHECRCFKEIMAHIEDYMINVGYDIVC